MATYTATKKEIEAAKQMILEHRMVSNKNGQYFITKNGEMFSYINDKYTTYSDLNKFARHIVRFQKTGY